MNQEKDNQESFKEKKIRENNLKEICLFLLWSKSVLTDEEYARKSDIGNWLVYHYFPRERCRNS